MDQELIDTILATVSPVLITQEAVYGGFRPTVRQYPYSESVTMVEEIEYYEPASSDGWANVKTKTFYVL